IEIPAAVEPDPLPAGESDLDHYRRRDFGRSCPHDRGGGCASHYRRGQRRRLRQGGFHVGGLSGATGVRPSTLGGLNMKLARKLAIGVAFAFAAMTTAANAADVKIALVVKSLGNGFFEAANKGAEEAAKELGDVEIIYTGPTTTTAEGQIEVINSLIAQGVDAIAISANDPDAVIPALKKAAQRGIKVISWD